MGSEKAKRPKILEGRTYKVKMPNCGTLFVTINLPLEVLCRMGKSQACQNAWIEAVSRLISLALQNGADVEDVIEQLQGIRCQAAGIPFGGKGKAVLSCPDAIARTLKEEITPTEEVQNSKDRIQEGPLVYRNNISDTVA